MELLMEHAKLAIRMHKNNINLKLLRSFTPIQINECCNRLEDDKMLKSRYKESEIIQKELVRDENSIKYIIEAYDREIDMNKFEYLINDISNHNEKITSYSMEDILNVVNNSELNERAFYDYLKYFSNSDSEQKKIITNNLNHFYSQNYIKFEELSAAERKILTEGYLDNYNLIPTHNNVKRIYECLSMNKTLRKIIDFLYLKELYIPLNIEKYEKINSNAEKIFYYIKSIETAISNKELMYQLLLKWLNNGCSIYDLEIIEQRINGVELEQLEKAFRTRSGYINFIYGDRLERFLLESITEKCEELIIYAIRNNKKSFLKLIEQHKQDFLAIPINSILYQESFYSKYINLNELTIKNLIKLKTMYYERYTKIFELKEQEYTFEEISTLYNVNETYIFLYNELLDLKVDERILRIRQLIKRQLLHSAFSQQEIKNLADKIKVKPLYEWLEKDFKDIEDIKAEDVVELISNYEEISHLIPEIKKKNELAYILRNKDKMKNYENMKSIRKDIEILDKDWIKLKSKLEFNAEFIEKYSKNIKQFLLNNGSGIAYKYYIDQNTEQKEAFKLIIKAELMGEFKKLKYHTNDLNEEIDYNLKQAQIEEWTNNNSSLAEGQIEVGEYDDFYSTMLLGEKPQRTCLSYRNGMYNQCLLACFDSNKKILYAKINGKVVARAMIRLTKGTYQQNQKRQTLSFIDVENNTLAHKEERKEKLTLFLERSYIVGTSISQKNRIIKLFIKLLEKKAKKMNALLVLSNYYSDYVEDQYIKTRYYMYISKSKSSSQYLDSLDGQATVTDEGQYKANNFLIWKKESDKERDKEREEK